MTYAEGDCAYTRREVEFVDSTSAELLFSITPLPDTACAPASTWG